MSTIMMINFNVDSFMYWPRIMKFPGPLGREYTQASIFMVFGTLGRWGPRHATDLGFDGLVTTTSKFEFYFVINVARIVMNLLKYSC